MIRVAIALATILVPALAEACASCISSAFGDRTYNWPYLVLILVPFVLGGAIVAVFVRVTGTTVADVRKFLAQIFHPVARQEERT